MLAFHESRISRRARSRGTHSHLKSASFGFKPSPPNTTTTTKYTC